MKTRMISSETHIHVLGNPSNVPFWNIFGKLKGFFVINYPTCASVDPYTSARI